MKIEGFKQNDIQEMQKPREGENTLQNALKHKEQNEKLDNNAQIKKFEDYSYAELQEMAKTDPDKVTALNNDFRERYEAEIRDMSPEEYREYKYRLEASQSKEDMNNYTSSKNLEDVEKEKNVETNFDDIEQRVLAFRQEFKDGYSTASDEKKALGANLVTINDIRGLRSDIQTEKEKAWNKIVELKNENPCFDHTNNAEYKEAAEKYSAMESMETKLNAWEAELDGKDYAMAEELGVPYHQQTEHYHETRDQRLAKMEAYFNGTDGENRNGIMSKLENDSTEPLDKFQFQFQKYRMKSALDDIKENGTPEQKERVEKLSEQLDKADADFKNVHNEYSLNKDGTTTKKVDTYHSGKTIELADNSRDLNNGGVKKTHAELNYGGKHITEKGENFLYTGESTGKSSKKVTHEGVNIKSTATKTGVDKHGEAYKKESTVQATALKAEYSFSRDNEKMKYSADAGAALLNTSVSKEKETEGGTKTSFTVEGNVGHIKATASADMKNGEYKATSEVTQADGKASLSIKDKEGNTIEASVSGKVGGYGAEVGMDKYGPSAKITAKETKAGAKLSVNDVEVLGRSISAEGNSTIEHQSSKELKDAFKGLDNSEKLIKSYSENELDGEGVQKRVVAKTETFKQNDVQEVQKPHEGENTLQNALDHKKHGEELENKSKIDDDKPEVSGANEKTKQESPEKQGEKKFEDYSYAELQEMAKTDPDKVTALNADFRERYEAEIRDMSPEEYREYKSKILDNKDKIETTENNLSPTDVGEKPKEKITDELAHIESTKNRFGSVETQQDSGITTDTDEAFKNLAEYLSRHEYTRDDFDTYSQDPEWRALQKEAFPNYELPPLSQESARTQLSDYMNNHDYTQEDFDTYSKDPEWRELQKAAFPDYELPPIGSEEYCSAVNALRDANVSYRPIEPVAEQRTTSEIINRLGGGDMTEGSCSSLAFAYVGNKAGYDVLDFRDGDSREYFASFDSVETIANLPGVDSKTVFGNNDISCAKELLGELETGKEYYLATGYHASIVRRTEMGFEYLELQEPQDNGWKSLGEKELKERFGCETDHLDEYPNFLIDVESLGKSEEFLDILGYINTADEGQVKGVWGYGR